MTLRTFDLNGGPEGAAVTMPNSGASLVGTSANGTALYRAAAAVIGAFGARITSIGTNIMTLQFPLDVPNVQASFSFFIKIPSGGAPAANTVLAQFRQTSATICNLVYATNGNLEFWKTTAAKEATLLASGSVSSAGFYRISLVVNSATGVYVMKIYSGTSTTALNTISGTTTFTSTAAFTDLRFQASGPSPRVTDVDNVQTNDGSTVEIVPGSNIPPTVLAPGNQDVAAGTPVTLHFAASDADGTIASRSTTVLYSSDPTFDNTDLVNPTTADVGLTAPVAGHLLILQHVAVDNSGASSDPVTVEVRTPLSGGFTTLPAPGVGGAWTNVGGAATGGAALADALDTTYVESSAYTGTESERLWRLQPLAPRSDLTLTPKHVETATGGTLKFRLYQGATLIQEWSATPVTSAATESFAVGGTQLLAITDPGNLYAGWAVST